MSRLRVDQRTRWLQVERVSAEDYLRADPEVAVNRELLLDLIYSEICLREEIGEFK